ncbi:MAG: phosphotransferase, partial [Proteobacteria bacterium]|nr:phosphotransferase [Pseudomonadota bacterium]
MPVDQLASWFGDRLGAADTSITESGLLPGGAVQHNWRIDLDVAGAPQSYVLRAGPAVSLPESISKADEFDILRDVFVAGIPVAEPLWWRGGDTPFFVSRLCAGDARRDGLIGRADNMALLRDLGAALAGIHHVEPVGHVNPDTPSARVATLMEWVGHLTGVPTPVTAGFSGGLAWLCAHAPDDGAGVLV